MTMRMFAKLYRHNHRRIVVIVSSLALVALSGLFSSLSAAQISQAYISLSSSSVNATQVVYDVNFSPVESASAFVIDFCSNSPVIGQPCVAPTGMDVSAVSSSTAGFTVSNTLSNTTLVLTGAVSGSTPLNVLLAGVTNPDSPGTIYARIVSYNATVNAAQYQSQDIGSGSIDSGSVAIPINRTISVTGTVLESMTFCVSASDIEADCNGATNPVLTLGEDVGGARVLVPGVLSEGHLFVQLSTNASSGAVVRLKSSAVDCGGLMRSGSPDECYITPAQNLGINLETNDAKFGVKTGVATDVVDDSSGVLQPVPGSGYNDTTFTLNYMNGNATGVTSMYGDAFLDSDDKPVNNKNMRITFGASANNSTPAGSYSADISLVAIGKF